MSAHVPKAHAISPHFLVTTGFNRHDLISVIDPATFSCTQMGPGQFEALCSGKALLLSRDRIEFAKRGWRICFHIVLYLACAIIIVATAYFVSNHAAIPRE